MNATIDPRAVVSPKARLGTNVSIGPFTIVEDGAEINDGTVIEANALIGRGARIGKDCHVHHGAVIGHVPQDLKYNDEPTTCEIGERTTVREYAVFHRGTGEGGRTVIGSDCFLMAFTHVAHDCRLGNHIIMANAVMMAGHCEVGDWVTLGGITPIHQFVRIGCHAMVGGGLRVPKDVPPYILAGGEPLVFEGLNSVGLRRRGFLPQTLAALERAYEAIYRSKLNVSQAIARIRDDASLMGHPEVATVVEFVTGSKRGIIPGPRLRA